MLARNGAAVWASGFRFGVAAGIPLGLMLGLALLIWVQS